MPASDSAIYVLCAEPQFRDYEQVQRPPLRAPRDQPPHPQPHRRPPARNRPPERAQPHAQLQPRRHLGAHATHRRRAGR